MLHRYLTLVSREHPPDRWKPAKSVIAANSDTTELLRRAFIVKDGAYYKKWPLGSGDYHINAKYCYFNQESYDKLDGVVAEAEHRWQVALGASRPNYFSLDQEVDGQFCNVGEGKTETWNPKLTPSILVMRWEENNPGAYSSFVGYTPSSKNSDGFRHTIRFDEDVYEDNDPTIGERDAGGGLAHELGQ